MAISPSTSSKREASEDRDISPPPSKRRGIASANKQAVTNFFTKTSQKAPEKITWSIRDDTLITAQYSASSSNGTEKISMKQKIAAFDFDSTLILPKSGAKHAKDGQDWKWWHSTVPGKLKQLHADGYAIAVVSNQGGISLRPASKLANRDKKRLADFKQKAVAVFNHLDIPIRLYAATEHDIYRKPSTGMWTELLKDIGRTIDDVDLDESVFIGDAAGRTATAKLAADFSCSDRNFAENLGLRFQTPEEFFLGEQPRPFQRSFDPVKYIQPIATHPISILFSTKTNPELVIFVGSPGSGKSTFYMKHLAPLGYQRVNQDILKKRDVCIEVAREHLKNGKSVAVDNTNRNKETRKVWVDLAKSLRVPIRCIHFKAGQELCKHNNAVRAHNALHNPEKRGLLPSQAFPMFAKAFEKPVLEEGFEDITEVDFVFEGSEEERQIWAKFWT